jgi:hypothetical protein
LPSAGKNYRFARSDAGARAAGILYSVVGRCCRLGHDPFHYLRDVFSRLSSVLAGRIDELLPTRPRPHGTSSRVSTRTHAPLQLGPDLGKRLDRQPRGGNFGLSDNYSVTMIASPATAFCRAGVTTAVLVALALSSGRASAACGDYVTIRDAATPEHPMAGPARGDHGPKSPCQGPSCSGRPAAPPTPAPPPSGQAPDAKAFVVGSDDPGETGSRGVVPPPPGRTPLDHPRAIFHPPRA